MRRLYLTWLQRLLWYPIKAESWLYWRLDVLDVWLREVRWNVEKRLLKELGCCRCGLGPMNNEQVSEPKRHPPGVMVSRRVGSDDEGWSNEWMPATTTELLDALTWHLDQTALGATED